MVRGQGEGKWSRETLHEAESIIRTSALGLSLPFMIAQATAADRSTAMAVAAFPATATTLTEAVASSLVDLPQMMTWGYEVSNEWPQVGMGKSTLLLPPFHLYIPPHSSPTPPHSCKGKS
jgi:hypothetical protein